MSNSNMPAMPLHAESTLNSYMGLTKREYFAGLAMQGILSDSEYRKRAGDIACAAVAIADVLLSELEKS